MIALELLPWFLVRMASPLTGNLTAPLGWASGCVKIPSQRCHHYDRKSMYQLLYLTTSLYCIRLVATTLSKDDSFHLHMGHQALLCWIPLRQLCHMRNDAAKSPTNILFVSYHHASIYHLRNRYIWRLTSLHNRSLLSKCLPLQITITGLSKTQLGLCNKIIYGSDISDDGRDF